MSKFGGWKGEFCVKIIIKKEAYKEIYRFFPLSEFLNEEPKNCPPS
jgi:hypothetical protein